MFFDKLWLDHSDDDDTTPDWEWGMDSLEALMLRHERDVMYHQGRGWYVEDDWQQTLAEGATRFTYRL